MTKQELKRLTKRDFTDAEYEAIESLYIPSGHGRRKASTDRKPL